MRKVLTFIYLFILIVFLKLFITFVINEMYISKYNKGDYYKNLVKSLFVLNFSERYIAYYNYGNLLYQIGYFEDAINEYNKALELKVPEDRVCDIRINLSIATLSTMMDDMECEEKYEIYEKALDILYTNGCAEEDDDTGISESAEKLEEEILRLYAEEKAICEQQGSSGKDDDKTDEEKEEDQKKHDELEDRNDSANESRQEELDEMEDYDDYEYYNGKKW